MRAKRWEREFGWNMCADPPIPGLNGFHGLEVTSANIDIAAMKNNFNGTVDIPNASILTIDIVRRATLSYWGSLH